MRLKVFLTALFCLVTIANRASASSISFTLGSPLLSTQAGGAVTFIATIAAPVSNITDVYLNSDTVNVAFPLTADDTPFFGTPAFLSPGQSYTGPIVIVTVPGATVPGLYGGTFTIFGGADGGADTKLGSQDFSVRVFASQVPEPVTITSLGIGLVGLVTRHRRNRCQRG